MPAVLHVIPSMNPCDGGPVTAVRDFVRATARLGCKSEIATLDSPGAAWLSDADCPVVSCGEGQSPAWTSRRLRDWMIQNADRFDCAVVHGLWLYPTRCAAEVRRRTGLPFAVYSHGMLDVAHRRTFPIRHIKKSLWWAACEQRVLSQASAVFFTSELEKQLAANTFWPRLPLDRARIVPYAVEPPPPEAERHIDAFRRRFPAIEGRRLILFMSRIHPKKGIELLLDAFAETANDDTSLHLMIAGSGSPSYDRRLRKLAVARGISDRITWPGLLQDDLKWGALRSAELLCLPSFQENFGIVIAEALACATPVIITDRVNIASMISSAGAALVTDCTRYGVTSGLRRWLAMPPADRSAMRSRAINCFARAFSSDTAAANFLAALPHRDVSAPQSGLLAAGTVT